MAFGAVGHERRLEGEVARSELKHAARVYGISFSGSSAEDDDDCSVDPRVLMDGQPRISNASLKWWPLEREPLRSEPLNESNQSFCRLVGVETICKVV